MRLDVRSARAHRRLTWLLCLALLWPLAQTAAAWHALSHAAAPAGAEGPARRAGTDHAAAAHAATCELCLAAAAVGSAALPAAAPLLPAVAPRVPAPGRLALAAPSSPRLAAYRSRAPPSFAC